MMALSNYEYGGTTLEELNDLAKQREKVPRPSAQPNINRIFTTLKPDTEKIPLQQFNAVESTVPEKDFPKPPPAPFNKRLRDDVENGEEDRNPFEEIVTRAPRGFQRTRKRVRMHDQDSSPRFLSRSSIIHPSTKPPPTTTKTPINDPKEGFEDVFMMPHARKLQQRNFDHEEHLQSEWAKKNEAKMSYRRHSGQNMTTPEQEEMAASYRKIKGKLQGETVADSYRIHRDKIRVEPAEEQRNEEADHDADSVDILDVIMEDEILKSARENLKEGQKTTKKTKKIEEDLPEFPTLSPIEPDDPSGESIPIPLSLPVALDNNPFSEVDMTRPAIVKLPLPPTMWSTEWMTDFNK